MEDSARGEVKKYERDGENTLPMHKSTSAGIIGPMPARRGKARNCLKVHFRRGWFQSTDPQDREVRSLVCKAGAITGPLTGSREIGNAL